MTTLEPYVDFFWRIVDDDNYRHFIERVVKDNRTYFDGLHRFNIAVGADNAANLLLARQQQYGTKAFQTLMQAFRNCEASHIQTIVSKEKLDVILRGMDAPTTQPGLLKSPIRAWDDSKMTRWYAEALKAAKKDPKVAEYVLKFDELAEVPGKRLWLERGLHDPGMQFEIDTALAAKQRDEVVELVDEKFTMDVFNVESGQLIKVQTDIDIVTDKHAICAKAESYANVPADQIGDRKGELIRELTWYLAYAERTGKVGFGVAFQYKANVPSWVLETITKHFGDKVKLLPLP